MSSDLNILEIRYQKGAIYINFLFFYYMFSETCREHTISNSDMQIFCKLLTTEKVFLQCRFDKHDFLLKIQLCPDGHG